VTFALIALNILVFVWPQGMNDPQRVEADFALEWAAIPCEVVTGDGLTEREFDATFRSGADDACDLDPTGAEAYPNKPVRIAVIFSMFMHAGWLHLAGNVWFLWIFGNNVEEHLGPLRYLAFYLAGGIVASVAHIALQPNSTIPVVGASGAVAGVMGAYAIWFPNAPIRSLVVILLWSIRAKWWLAFWLLSQFFTGDESQVAWMAHVGGFVFGMIVAIAVRRSPAARRRVLRSNYHDVPSWDSTGGIGSGPYARPRRIVGRPR
jgi:membrane associated rhomboid family serine protease